MFGSSLLVNFLLTKSGLGPEQHVAHSSNYSLYMTKTDSFDPVAQHVLGTRGSRHTAENHAVTPGKRSLPRWVRGAE